MQDSQVYNSAIVVQFSEYILNANGDNNNAYDGQDHKDNKHHNNTSLNNHP